MSSLLLPHSRTRQPGQQARLDWANRLLQKIQPVGVYVFMDGVPVNLVTGKSAVAYGAPQVVIDPSGGRALYSQASSGGAHYWNTGLFPDNTYRFLACWERPLSAFVSDGNWTNGSHDGTRRFYVAPAYTDSTKPIFGWGSAIPTSTVARTYPQGVREMLAMQVDSANTIYGYVDGKQVVSSAGATWTGTSTRNIYIGKRTLNSSTENGSIAVGPNVNIDLYIFGRGNLTASEMLRLYENPWQIFRPMPRKIWVSVPGGAAVLDGNATAQSTVSASLTTSIQIAAASISTATAAAALTASISLSGQAASVTLADGVLTTHISLSGSAIAQALASAGLSTAIPLDGAAESSAAASGLLTTQITLSGAALAQTLASASLTTAPAGLAADAAASASASGDLMTAIPLAGAASAIAIGAGGLTVGILLQAYGAAVSNATGDLTVSFGISASALASALATGDLSTQISLSASALAQAFASGSIDHVQAEIVMRARSQRAAEQSRRSAITHKSFRVNAPTGSRRWH